MNDPFITVMGNDHKHWTDDCTAWLEDIEHWQADHRRALEVLEKIDRAIKKRDKTLAERLAAIKSHKRSIDDHEAAIAAYQPAYASEHEAELMSVHEREATSHMAQKNVQEQMKKNHYAVLAQLSLVMKALDNTLEDKGWT